MACICSIYLSVSSFVPDKVPLMPSVETKILPFKLFSLQNSKCSDANVSGHQLLRIYSIKSTL